MYCTFYGLKERPFTLTPNPEFIFLGTAHQEAFAHLLYGIGQKVGFIALTGEVGAGKTTVIRTLLTRLEPEHYATALILNPMLSSLGLLKTINREFDISDQGSEPAELVETLNRFLLEQQELGKTVVLVIDEAQDMEPAVLEQVRLLSNLETATEKLIQIVLVGQPEFETILGRDDMRQLNQRITVRYHMLPMSGSDTRDYLAHRLRAAGGSPDLVRFSDSAARLIHRFAGGLPRLVNAVADRALLIGYNRDLRQLDDAVVRQAISEVSPAEALRNTKRKRLLAGALLAALCILLPGLGLSLWWYTASAKQPAQSAVQDTTARSVELLLQHVTGTGGKKSVLEAVMRVWHLPAPAALSSDTPLEVALKRSGLDWYRYSGNLGTLARIGYPALLELNVHGQQTHLFFAGLEQADALVADQHGAIIRVQAAGLEPYWSGKALIPWQNSFGLQVPTPYSTNSQQRQQLARLLTAAGALPQAPTAVSDTVIRDALKGFQRRHNLEAAGVAGGQTLLLLYRQAASAPHPDLKRLENQRP